jgi:hypothetical protein
LRFVGCALAWRPGEAREKASCLVVLDERGSIIANSFVADAEEIARTVEGYGSERRGTVVGVDAPLAVPNERGTRKIERILSKMALPAYSASRRMFGGEPYAEELLSELEKAGVEYTDYPFPRERGLPFPPREGPERGRGGRLRGDVEGPLLGALGCGGQRRPRKAAPGDG